LIAEEVGDLCDAWMRHADQVLADERIVAAVYEALVQRHPKSRSRGRQGTPAEVVLRLLVLKHVRNWSYAVLEREVRANGVSDFTQVGADKMPDAKTVGRWGVALGPAVIKRIHDRIIGLAQAEGIAPGLRMGYASTTTVVETTIHYPTSRATIEYMRRPRSCRVMQFMRQ
jgi:IS5 family transposase